MKRAVSWKRPVGRFLQISLSAILLVAVAFAVVACSDDVSNKVTLNPAATSDVTWTGNGSENNCEFGGQLHWILTPGGNVEITSGELHVFFSDGTSATFPGYFPGQGRGAMHFDSTGTTSVDSAHATYTYTGTLRNPVLTISHSVCNPGSTTTTSSTTTSSTTTSSTTTSSTSSTSTTVPPTSTSVGGVTSTTAASTTSTTVGGTTTTVSPTTTTSESTTTTASTTTTSLPTSTTEGGVTTTSESTTTTSPSTPPTSETGGQTTTTGAGVGGVTTTTQGSITTAGGVQAGGGGTADSGRPLWVVVALFGSLAAGVLAFAARPRRVTSETDRKS